MKLKGLLAASLLATVATAAVAGPYDAAVQKALDAKAVMEQDVALFTALTPVEQNVYTTMLKAPNYATLSADGRATLFATSVLKSLKEGSTKDNPDVQEFVKKFDGTDEEKQQAYLTLVDRLAFVDKFFLEDIPAYQNAVIDYKKLVRSKGAELFQGRDQAVLGHLVQGQLSYDLLKDLNAADANKGFANLQGAYAANADASDLANFGHFGYKLQSSDNTALGAFVSVGNEKTKAKSETVSAKQNAVDLGLGLYAAANAGNFKLSGLFQAYAGDTRVNNEFTQDVEATYQSMLSKIVKLYDDDPLKNEAFSDSVNVNKGVASFTGKVEYAYKVNDGLTVTPALFGQAVKTSKQYEVTTARAEYSLPSMFSYQAGAAVAVDYKVTPAVELGGDLAVSYVKTTAGTYTYDKQVVDFTPPAGEELLFKTTYKTEKAEADYTLKNVRVAAQAKLAYHVTPNTTVTAKAGYNYLTKSKAHSGTYGLDVAFKF